MSILKCSALEKRYGKVLALDGVDMEIMPGRIVGLLGPNGSGKTTLIKLANALLSPSGGNIEVCGHAPGQESHALVSYLPERAAIPTWMTVEQRIFMQISADRQRKKCSAIWGYRQSSA